MISLKNKQSGFTIVELLIVIVVIGILAALVITTFSGIQQKGRNTERTTDVQAIASQLEAYYATGGSYPEFNTINTSTEGTTVFKGLDAEAYRDPTKNAGPDLLAIAPATGHYQYVALPAGCTTAANDCTSFTLTAVPEGCATSACHIIKKSLN